MRKKFIATILCFGLLTGLCAGCTDSTEPDTIKDTAKQESASTPSGAQTAEIKTGTNTDLTTLSVFINMSWYPVDSFTGKIPDAIKAQTGVDLDVTIATDANQLGVMIASGELPDLVFSDTNLNELSDSEVSYSLNELAEITSVDFKNSENYEERSRIAQSLSSDSQAYALLSNYSSQEQWADLKIGAPGQTCIYYRKDLLEAAGIKVPGNLEEFMECLGKVKEAYPGMTPFGMGGYWKLHPVFNWCGVSAGQYNVETGEYRYDTSVEVYKDYLSYCNRLYRSGYINAEEYANENEADGHQKAYNDGCVFYAWYLAGSSLTQLQSNAVTKTAEWAVLAPLGEAQTGNSKGWAGTFVSKNCKEPEAAAKLLAYLNTVEGSRTAMWGVEGEDYTLGADGVPQFSADYLTARTDTEKWYSEYNPMFYFGSSAINEIYENYSGMEPEKLEQFTSYSKGYKNYPELGIALPATTSDEGVIKTKLDEIKKKYEAKVIFTDTDEAFERAYIEYMDAASKTGVITFNEYMTGRIAEVKQDYGF